MNLPLIELQMVICVHREFIKISFFLYVDYDSNLL